MKMLLVGLLLLSIVGGGGPCVNSDGHEKERAYLTTQDELTNAIAQYATDNMGDLPILAGNYSVAECTNCSIIDINALLTSQGGILIQVPDGTYSAAGANNDNCDGGAYGCLNNSHYVWLIDEYGNVYSKCMGHDCDSNNATGYQGVYP